MPESKVYLSAPIAKTVETADGGREVWGFATLEVVDKAGEIADFEGTVKAFEKWSSDVSKRTNGKSLGNVRLMHQPIAVGKTIHWEPTETTVQKDDGTDETVKAIWVGVYVPPTKPDVVKDIDEGILSAFSIGGSYAKRWYDNAAKAFRFIPELSEYSLVDNPCVPGADIVNVIGKADGPWSKPDRNLGEGGEDMEKKAPEGSYEAIQDKLNAAICSGWHDRWVVLTYPDKVVVRDWDADAYFEVPYTIDDNGCVELGDPVQVEQTYVPIEAQKMADVARKERDAARKEANKAVTPEELVKALIADAMKAAQGGTVGDRKWEEYDKDTLTKAASLLEKAIEQVDEIAKREQTEANAGDKGDKGDQKDADVLKAAREVLEKIVAEVKKVASGEGAEAQTPDDDNQPGDNGDGSSGEKSGDANKGASPEELAKRGVAISKSRATHLQHAKNHLDAAMNGTDYTAADHEEWEKQMTSQEPNNVEQETDAEKGMFSGLRKGITEDVLGALTTFEGLAKAEDLGKAIEAITGVAKNLETVLTRMDDIEKRLKTIEEQPAQGGPLSNPQELQRYYKSTPVTDTAALEKSVLEKMANDPTVSISVRQEIAKNLALQAHPLAK